MRARWCAGYLMFEVLVVIALILVLSATALQSYRWVQSALVRMELDALYMQLLATSQEAVCTGGVRTVLCTEQGIRTQAGERPLAHAVQFGAQPGVFGPPSAPTHPLVDPVTFVNHTIVCYPDGTISSGAIYLTDRDRMCTYALSCAVGIMNYVRRYRYEGHSWVLLP